MLRRSGIFPITQKQAMTGVSIAVTCAGAVVLLGPVGGIASIVFLPLIVALAISRDGVEQSLRLKTMPDARDKIEGDLSRFLGQIGHPTVSMVVQIDGLQQLEEMHDHAVLEGVMNFTQSVIDTHLTEEDITVSLDGATFVSALAPQAPHDLEVMLNTCTRIQHSLSSAQLFSDVPVQLSASIGFASSAKLDQSTGASLLQASFTALAEARRKGPGAVRGYSHAMEAKRVNLRKFGKEASSAFDRGEIVSYFQPQICLTDGSLSGFEALTRWRHPERGILTPAEFLPILEKAGLMGRLGDTMARQALQALNYWDESGIHVPQIGVNFSTSELSDPFLVDRIAMLLDASDLEPHRLVIEVLETVVASHADDDIICNLAALADLGCGIDLDDFGTGYASIANIRRFCVGRIKIDRAFIAGLDDDEEQRDMVAAILNMAERLGVKTLAEGIESKSEQAVLLELGCSDAQGFHIARPMPLDETVDWTQAHFRKVVQPTQIARRAG